jgi:UDP-N-acetylglucosamine acyltransferase
MIHATAIIHPGAKLGTGVRIGPYAVVDEGVELGDGCELGPHVYLTGEAALGARNKIHAGCVIGGLPQDMRFKGGNTSVRIGDDNVFHEHVTIHRSNSVSEPTRIGSNNFLMAHSHVGHNAVVGNHVIVANGALLAGHVEVQDRVFISGNCLIHQFVRVGTLALMQGGSAISKDLPPYTIARGDNSINGLNTVGLRRAGFTSEDRLELRKLYQALFRRNIGLRQAAEQARELFESEQARALIDFIVSSTRGVCAEKSRAGIERATGN